MSALERPAADPGRQEPPQGGVNPRTLYDTHFAFVWRNLRRMGVPESAIDDAAQDVFLVVHRRWGSFDGRWSTVETWLFGIVMRIALNHRRSARRRWTFFVPTPRQDVMETAEAPTEEPVDRLERREAMVMFERVLASLGDERRAVFVMVDVEQMSVPEAAEALQVNLNTAYSRLRAARLEFKRAVDRTRAAERREQERGRP